MRILYLLIFFKCLFADLRKWVIEHIVSYVNSLANFLKIFIHGFTRMGNSHDIIAYLEKTVFMNHEHKFVFRDPIDRVFKNLSNFRFCYSYVLKQLIKYLLTYSCFLSVY